MAKKTRSIVLYGNSLVISSIAANLVSQPDLCVHQLKAANTDLSQIELFEPDVFIFDWAEDQTQDAITLLKDHPEILLIGIEPINHQMFVWSGRHVRALTVQDLVQAINTLPGSASRLDRLRQFISAATPTRRQQLALAAAGIVICLALTLALAQPAPRELLGTVTGGVSPELALALTGIVLGGVLIGLWLGKRYNTPKT